MDKDIKILRVEKGLKMNIKNYPSYHRCIPIKVIRNMEGENALLVRCGNRVYNVIKNRRIYDEIK